MTGRSSILHNSPFTGVGGSSRTLISSLNCNKLVVVFPGLNKNSKYNFITGKSKSLSNSILQNAYMYDEPYLVNSVAEKQS